MAERRDKKRVYAGIAKLTDEQMEVIKRCESVAIDLYVGRLFSVKDSEGVPRIDAVLELLRAIQSLLEAEEEASNG